MRVRRQRRIARRAERSGDTESSRRRRSPEVARQEILDAAEQLFATAHPDDVGLKEVGRATGVSHALVTHYFGTYANLVESVLERRIKQLREVMAAKLAQPGVVLEPEVLLQMLFDALADPIHLRLTRWMFGREQPAEGTFAFRERGLQQIAHQIATALLKRPSANAIEKIENAILTAVCAAYGYALGKQALAGALGRPANAELDREVQRTVAAMLRAHLAQELAAYVPRESE